MSLLPRLPRCNDSVRLFGVLPPLQESLGTRKDDPFQTSSALASSGKPAEPLLMPAAKSSRQVERWATR
jgi:hypothetical protein